MLAPHIIAVKLEKYPHTEYTLELFSTGKYEGEINTKLLHEEVLKLPIGKEITIEEFNRVWKKYED